MTGTIAVSIRPPWRKPTEELVALAGWFNGLSFQDRESREQVIEMTAHAAVFQLLCVLDGAVAIGQIRGHWTFDICDATWRSASTMEKARPCTNSFDGSSSYAASAVRAAIVALGSSPQ